MARILEIDILGTDYNDKIEENVIYRLNKKPKTTPDYRYLVVSEKIDQLFPSIDILVIREFKKIKDNLKRNIKKGIGLEVTISDLRKAEGPQVGKWFNQLRDIHKFCKSSNCQLIISSGACSSLEMVSGRCFESILKTCGMQQNIIGMTLKIGLSQDLGARCLQILNKRDKRRYLTLLHGEQYDGVTIVNLIKKRNSELFGNIATAKSHVKLIQSDKNIIIVSCLLECTENILSTVASSNHHIVVLDISGTLKRQRRRLKLLL